MTRLIALLVPLMLTCSLVFSSEATSRYLVRYNHPAKSRLNELVPGLAVETLTHEEADAKRHAPDVEYVVADVKVFAQGIPESAEFVKQWYVRADAGTNSTSSCNPPSGTPITDHRIYEAWKYLDERGLVPGKGVVVAVSDSGVFYDHVQLKNAIVGHTYFRDGIEFPSQTDTDSHASWVSGIIAATFDHQRPVGVAYGSKIYSLGFIACNGGFLSDGLLTLARAVELKKQGVNIRVMNMSWGCYCPDLALPIRDAVKALVDEGIFVAIAAGNNATISPYYPAIVAKDIDGAISVGAVGPRLVRAYFSNHGPNAEIGAAGCDVVGGDADRTGIYVGDGTSAAAPLVASLAALLIGVNPTLQPPDVERIIRASYRHQDGLNFLTPGVADFRAALEQAP